MTNDSSDWLEFASPALSKRLKAIVNAMYAQYEGGSDISSANKGVEREIFVSQFLRQVFPPEMRFAAGEVVDADGNQSGQLDVVLETPSAFSLPMVADGPRLFFAECVAAALEIKSNLTDQWKQVTKTAEKLAEVQPFGDRESSLRIASELKEGRGRVVGTDEEANATVAKIQAAATSKPSTPPIPLYVIGFSGWASSDALSSNFADADHLEGVLQLDRHAFISRSTDGVLCGPMATGLFLTELHRRFADADLKPFPYHYQKKPSEPLFPPMS